MSESSKQHLYKRIPWRLAVVLAVVVPPGHLTMAGRDDVARGPVIISVCIGLYVIFWFLRRDWHNKHAGSGN